jgi:hypothetical protein
MKSTKGDEVTPKDVGGGRGRCNRTLDSPSDIILA